MSIPLLDLKAQYGTIKDEIDRAIRDVVESQYFILGPTVQRFEQEIGGYLKGVQAAGVSSGSDALVVALLAAEVGPGDEVITTPYTFFATAGSITLIGAKPVFVDIDPRTYNIDVAKIRPALTKQTKAIIPVHLFGQCADMDPIMEIAKERGLFVIEDAAQALSSTYKGRMAGTIGHLGCFSFFPSKNLGCFGDGGLVAALDQDLAKKVRMLRAHGASPKYHHQLSGVNARLDALQAAVLSVKLPHLDSWSDARRHNAAAYHRLFAEAGLTDTVTLPLTVEEGGEGRPHIFNQYVIRVPQRDELMAHLKDKGIGCEVYYPIPLHVQKCFADLSYGPGDFPLSEEAALSTLAIPVYPELTLEAQRTVVSEIAAFYGRATL